MEILRLYLVQKVHGLEVVYEQSVDIHTEKSMFKLLLLGLAAMRDCGNGLGRAPLIGFGSSPESPKPGDNVTTWIAYELSAPAITGGTATYSVSLNGLPFPPTVEDLCTQTSCPKEPGLYNETSSAIFPQISGKIVSQIAWRDPDDTLIWCVENTWRI